MGRIARCAGRWVVRRMFENGADAAPIPGPAPSPTTKAYPRTSQLQQATTTTTTAITTSLFDAPARPDQAPPRRPPSASQLRRGFRPHSRPVPRHRRTAADVDRRHRGHGRPLPHLLHTARRHAGRAVRACATRRGARTAARGDGPRARGAQKEQPELADEGTGVSTVFLPASWRGAASNKFVNPFFVLSFVSFCFRFPPIA